MEYAGLSSGHVVVATWASGDYVLFRSGYPSASSDRCRGALPPTRADRGRIARWSQGLNGQPDRTTLVDLSTPSTFYYYVASGAKTSVLHDLPFTSEEVYMRLAIRDTLITEMDIGFDGQGAPFALPIAFPITEWDAAIPADPSEYFRELPTHLVAWGSGVAFCHIPADDAAALTYHPDLVRHDMALTDIPVGVPAVAFRNQLRFRLSGASGSYVGSLHGDINTLPGLIGAYPGPAHLYQRLSGAGPARLGWISDSGVSEPGGGVAREADVAVRSDIGITTGGPDEPSGSMGWIITYYDVTGAEVGTQTESAPIVEVTAGLEWRADGDFVMTPPAGSWYWHAQPDPLSLPSGYAATSYFAAQGRSVPLPWLCHDPDGALVGPGWLRDLGT